MTSNEVRQELNRAGPLVRTQGKGKRHRCDSICVIRSLCRKGSSCVYTGQSREPLWAEILPVRASEGCLLGYRSLSAFRSSWRKPCCCQPSRLARGNRWSFQISRENLRSSGKTSKLFIWAVTSASRPQWVQPWPISVPSQHEGNPLCLKATLGD